MLKAPSALQSIFPGERIEDPYIEKYTVNESIFPIVA